MDRTKTVFDHFDKDVLDKEKWSFVNMGSPGCAMYEIEPDGVIRLQEANMIYEGHMLLTRRYLEREYSTIEAQVTSCEYGAGIGFYGGDGCWDNYIVFYILEDGHLEIRIPGRLTNGDAFMSNGQIKYHTVFKSASVYALPAVLKVVRKNSRYDFNINNEDIYHFDYDGIPGNAKGIVKSLSSYSFSGPGEFKSADFHYVHIDGFAPEGFVYGRVMDTSLNGVPEASVHLAGEEHYYVTSDNKGYFTISNAPRGKFIIIAAAEGYLFGSENIVVEGDPVSCTIVLEKETQSNIPRSEYNRPDFDRSDVWYNLNGTWKFDFDKHDVGETFKWYANHTFAKAIKVPFSWSSLEAFGEGFLANGRTLHTANTYFVNYKITGENGWYRKTITVPKNFPPEQNVILKIGACSALTKVWLDGSYIGAGSEQYGQMDFDLGSLEPGTSHTLVIKAQFPYKKDEVNLGKQIWWFNQSPGIWQTIWIEPRGNEYIKTIHMTPELTFAGDVCKNAAVKVDVEAVLPSKAAGKGASEPESRLIEITLFDPDDNKTGYAEIQLRTLENESNCFASIEIFLQNPKLWRVNDGKLYTAVVKLKNNSEVLDNVKTYFGLRRVSTDWALGHSPLDETDPKEQYKYIYLNNQPIYMSGVLDQGYNPWGIYTYPSFGPSERRGSIMFDIEKTREFGYNAIRMHIKENEPLWYYYCDKAGMLVWNEHPSNELATADNPTWRKVFENQLRGMLDRKYNHPSIIINSVFNESWGIEGRMCSSPWKNAQRQLWQKEMARLAKALDPTRLIVDNSGYGKTSETDITDFHIYPNAYYKAKEEWERVINNDSYPGSTYNCYNSANGEGHTGSETQRGQPLIISEFLHYDRMETLPRIFRKTAGYVRMNNTSQENEDTSPLTAERIQRDFGYVDRNFRSLGYSMVNADDMVVIDKNRVEKVQAGDCFSADVYTSHFSLNKYSHAFLNWMLTGTDEYGNMVWNTLSGSEKISFAQFTAEKAVTVSFSVPATLRGAYLFVWVECEGITVCQNYIQLEVLGSRNACSDKEKTVLEFAPAGFSKASWDHFSGSEINGECSVAWGKDNGFYEYEIDLSENLIRQEIKKGKIIFEAASRDAITGVHVTDEVKKGSIITVSVNGMEIISACAEDDPFDEKALFSYANLAKEMSYSYQGRFGYGYRFEADIPEEVLNEITMNLRGNNRLTVRFAANGGGMTLYGSRTGRYGINPMIILT